MLKAETDARVKPHKMNAFYIHNIIVFLLLKILIFKHIHFLFQNHLVVEKKPNTMDKY